MPPSSDNSPTEQTDEQLLALYCRTGDEAAFESLVLRYKRELFHFLLRFVSKRSFADEVFQEVFLQVHISAATFDPDRRFKPWLFTIAANKARDFLRRNKRRHAINISALSGSEGDEERNVFDLLEADIDKPGEVADQHELQALVQQLIADLPESLREILLLAYFQKLAYKEIADMLEIPLGTVKSRLHTAVGTFAKRWKAEYAAKLEAE